MTRVASDSVSRRAVVLLVVLAGVVAVTGGLATLVSDAARSTAASRTAFEMRLADDLLVACDAPIRHWLTHVSPTLVLPPDATSPSVVVLDDRIAIGRTLALVKITATDACGPARANISTFPLEVVEKILRTEELGGLDAIVQARHDGRLPPLPRADAPRQDARSVALVRISPRWEFRVVVTVSDVTRRWRCVYASANETWDLEERVVTDD